MNTIGKFTILTLVVLLLVLPLLAACNDTEGTAAAEEIATEEPTPVQTPKDSPTEAPTQTPEPSWALPTTEITGLETPH